MLWVGLTGGTGSGKSTVAGLLAGLGARVIDADALARQVVDPGTPALARIADEFGPDVIRPDGSLDRAGLAAIVFQDRAALARLEAITHPAIEAETARLRAGAPAAAVVIHDMPLIVEKGMAPGYHLVIVVDADVELRVARLAGRGMPADDARNRIASQAGEQQRRAVADVRLDNSGPPDDLTQQVGQLWDRLVTFEANLRAGRAADRPVAATDPNAATRVAARLNRAVARFGCRPILTTTQAADGALEFALELGVPDVRPGLGRRPTPAQVHEALGGCGLVPVTGGTGRGGLEYVSADPGQHVRVIVA